MIEIDGSHGEGGGQILRTALALSICTQQPVRITNIRAKRPKPGLMRQHLTAVKAVAQICGGEVEGAQIGSQTVTFIPSAIEPGDYAFDIGTAGSCTLVLQTVLPPLLSARGPSQIRVTGGTHNKAAPPVDFLQRAFLPLLARMGAEVTLELKRYGFFPRGGGEIVASISPVTQLQPIEFNERGERLKAYAEAYIAAVPLHVAQRELETVGKRLNWMPEQLHVRGLSNDFGPGNALTITMEHEYVTEVFTGFGEPGVTAETVAKKACEEAREYVREPIAVGAHLADQLLLPCALAGGGSFTTSAPTEHFRSNALVMERFLDVKVKVQRQENGVHRVWIE